MRSVISDGAWKSLHLASNELIEIFGMISAMPQPYVEFEDEIVYCS